VLRRLLRLRRFEQTGNWRELHNKELQELRPAPSIIRMVKLRRMRWEGLVNTDSRMNFG
jgi:hypothetical protein